MIYTRKLSKNYALDITALHFIRKFKDGISFGELKINLDLYKGDHCPKLNIIIVLFNFKIIEIDVYNVNHVE